MKSIVKKPWGFFEVLVQDKQYIIKKIKVIPGGILSLQSHINRSEHWIVVDGHAEVTLEKKIYNLIANETIFIPKESRSKFEIVSEIVRVVAAIPV